MVHTKTYIFSFCYSQYLVLLILTMAPRNNGLRFFVSFCCFRLCFDVAVLEASRSPSPSPQSLPVLMFCHALLLYVSL